MSDTLCQTEGGVFPKKNLNKIHFEWAFGIVLDSLLTEKKVNRRDFSIACGFEDYLISRIVTGKRVVMFEEAHSICKNLGVSMDYLGEKCTKLIHNPGFIEMASRAEDHKRTIENIKMQFSDLISHKA